MSKHIVVLSGSPRKGGNTDLLAAACMEGAEEAGKTVALFRTADMEIRGCLGCGHCFEEKGICMQKDDMAQILEKLREADALILASPVYYFGVSAQLKLVVDRMYALNGEKAPIKRAAMLLACANVDESVADGAVYMLERMCRFSDWENAGAIIAAGIPDKGEVKGHEALKKANALGRDI